MRELPEGFYEEAIFVLAFSFKRGKGGLKSKEKQLLWQSPNLKSIAIGLYLKGQLITPKNTETHCPSFVNNKQYIAFFSNPR